MFFFGKINDDDDDTMFLDSDPAPAILSRKLRSATKSLVK